MSRARALIDVDNMDAALAELREALTHDPESVYAHYLASVCLGRLGRNAVAKFEAKEAIRLDPDFPYAYWALANVALDEEKYGEGLRAIDTALSMCPTEALFLATKSVLLFDSDKPKQALEFAENALEFDPEDETARHVRALALVRLGRQNQAEAEVLENLRENADSSVVWHQRGIQLFAQGRLDEARTAFLESLRIDPENTSAQTGLMKTISAQKGFFSMFWRWTIFLYRFSPSTRYCIIFGLYFVVKVIRIIARRNPFYRPVLLPIIGLWALFCIYTWISQPLLRLAIRKGWIK